jgi:hypothetical protein
MQHHHLTEQQKDQLLDFFAYYLPSDLRYRLMAELPRCDNAWCGREVVRVIHTSDGEPVTPTLTRCEVLRGQTACHAFPGASA